MNGALDGVAVVVDDDPTPCVIVSSGIFLISPYGTLQRSTSFYLQHRRQSLSNHDGDLLHRQHQASITNNQNRSSTPLWPLSARDVCPESGGTGVSDGAIVDLCEEAACNQSRSGQIVMKIEKEVEGEEE